jgi:hypothetical protein
MKLRTICECCLIVDEYFSRSYLELQGAHWKKVVKNLWFIDICLYHKHVRIKAEDMYYLKLVVAKLV